MSRLLPVLCLLLGSTWLPGGTLRFNLPSFSFSITEPEGWMVDHRSAAQVAHLVLNEKGKQWRQADLVIFVRFVPNQEQESAEAFLQADEERFMEQCAFAEIQDVDLHLDGFQPYLIKSYECPGIQTEIVAVTQVSSHFALFVLSSQKGNDASRGLEPFRMVLDTFRWVPTAPARVPPLEHPPPPPR